MLLSPISFQRQTEQSNLFPRKLYTGCLYNDQLNRINGNAVENADKARHLQWLLVSYDLLHLFTRNIESYVTCRQAAFKVAPELFELINYGRQVFLVVVTQYEVQWQK